jgi:predicted ArsR family transcriptional regulator
MKTIRLTHDDELKIFMHPVRQKILHSLSINGPMTVKMIADLFNMNSSSIKNHIMQLMDLKVVEIDHQQLINGIRATYYRRFQGTVSIGSAAGGQREILAQNLLRQVQDGFFGKERQFKDEEGHFCADQLTGVVHLGKEEADQLYQMIRDFLNEHEGKKKETFPYVYSLVAYRE